MSEALPKSEEAKLPENVIRIEKPEAIYHLVLSSSHFFHQESIEPLRGSDAVILEDHFNYSDPELALYAADLFSKTDKQYKEIFRWCMENEKSIFYTDIQESAAVLILQKALRVLEFGAASALLYSLAKKARSKEPISRRSFLKAFGKATVGAYLAAPMMGDVSVLAASDKTSDHSSAAVVRDFLGDLNEKIHPETQVVLQTLRNYLMAQKMEFIARLRGQELKKKPVITMVVGAAHAHMKEAILEDSRKRVGIIRRILSIPGLEKDRKKISAIARIDYSKVEGKWHVHEYKDGELAPIEEDR